jgi:hypothetical protein
MTNINVNGERIYSDLKYAGCITSVLFQDDSNGPEAPVYNRCQEITGTNTLG